MSPATATAIPAPALTDKSRLNPLMGLRTVIVNCPAVAVGAAQMPTNVPLIALTMRCASVASVSAGYATAPKTVPPSELPPDGLPPFVVAPEIAVPVFGNVPPTVIHTVSAPTPNEFPGLIVPVNVTVA